MKLGQFITAYRQEHNISMREFARRSGMSVTHISNLEHGLNNEGKPISPTIDSFEKVARATGRTLNGLMMELHTTVRIGSNITDSEAAMIAMFRRAPAAIQDAIMVMLAPYDAEDDEDEIQ